MVVNFTLRNLKKRIYLNLVKIIGLSLALSTFLLVAIVTLLSVSVSFYTTIRNPVNALRYE